MGNNLETAKRIHTELASLIMKLESSWENTEANKIGSIFKDNNFTGIKLNYEYYGYNINKLSDLAEKVRCKISEYETIENEQIVTNSQMDNLIHKNYDDFVGDFGFMYGSLNDKSIMSRRDLVLESIKLYNPEFANKK